MARALPSQFLSFVSISLFRPELPNLSKANPSNNERKLLDQLSTTGVRDECNAGLGKPLFIALLYLEG